MSYKVLVWIEDNGLAHCIRTDNEEFNFLAEDEKHWGFNAKKDGERTVDNVLRMLASTDNKDFKIIEIESQT